MAYCKVKQHVFHSGDAVWNVFDAATKQKSWDHFTKGQRKTISQWFAVIRNVSSSYCCFDVFYYRMVCEMAWPRAATKLEGFRYKSYICHFIYSLSQSSICHKVRLTLFL